MTAEELGQMIWNVKELLRNVYDNKDVEDVILPFTLLRRLDCVLVGSESRVAANMKQLEELGQTSQEDIDNMMPMLSWMLPATNSTIRAVCHSLS